MISRQLTSYSKDLLSLVAFHTYFPNITSIPLHHNFLNPPSTSVNQLQTNSLDYVVVSRIFIYIRPLAQLYICLYLILRVHTHLLTTLPISKSFHFILNPLVLSPYPYFFFFFCCIFFYLILTTFHLLYLCIVDLIIIF